MYDQLSQYQEKYLNSLLCGFRKGSILSPLFFNLFINGIFLFIERANIRNLADDNTIYRCNIDLQTTLKDLKYDM